MAPPLYIDDNMMTETQEETISYVAIPSHGPTVEDGVDASSKMVSKQALEASSHRPQRTNDASNDDVSRAASCRAIKGANADVSELMVKAKKAAGSLWMILHAQNCIAQNCIYPQCIETQTLLEHVQSCPASTNPSSPCPTSCKGCNEARKLLAHYHKCKALRSSTNAQNNQSPHPSCLVCSLMARHAKNFTDKSLKDKATTPPTPRQRPRSESYPELKSPERKSRTVKFASCLRTTRYYHPEKDKSYCVARRPRSLSWGSNAVSESIKEEDGEMTHSEEIALRGSL